MRESGRRLRGGTSPGPAPPPAPSLNFLMLLLVFALSGLGLQLGLLPGSPLLFVFVLSGWVIGVCLHEFGHACVALRGGDHGVIGFGYLSLDPARYVNPFLTVVMPLLFLVMGGLALPGGSVRVDRSRLRGPWWETLVSAAGPIASLAVLGAVAILYGLVDEGSGDLRAGLAMLGFLQGMAVLLSLLPVPGLDGFGIVSPLLPARWLDWADRIAAPALVLVLLALATFAALGRAFTLLGVKVALWAGIGLDDLLQGMDLFAFWR